MVKDIEKVVFELTYEQKQQLIKAWTILGYRTQKAWLLEHIKNDYEKTLEGENHCQAHP